MAKISFNSLEMLSSHSTKGEDKEYTSVFGMNDLDRLHICSLSGQELLTPCQDKVMDCVEIGGI